MDGSGETTINPLQVANSISKTMDNEEAAPLVREAAWHNHVDLPMLGIAGSRGQQWFTKDDWNIPPEDDPSRKVPRPPMWPIHEGRLTAKLQ